MYKIYIDVPDNFSYDWQNSMGGVTGDIVLKKQLNADIKFICNRLAGISEGDCHSVTFNDEKEAVFWLLKNNFKQLNNEVVEGYIIKRDKIKKPFDKTLFTR